MTWIILTLFSMFGSKDMGNDAWWGSATAQTLITEFILLLVGAVYMGKTAHFAQAHGYCLGKIPSAFEQSSDAKLMYAGALWYLVSLFFFSRGTCWWYNCGEGRERRGFHRVHDTLFYHRVLKSLMDCSFGAAI